MGNFDRGRKFGSKPSFDKRNYGRKDESRGFDRRDDRHQMYPAVCSNCGKDCEVPFKPTGERPVFCSDCFKKTSGREDSRSSGGRNFDRRDSQRQPMFQAVCDNCGKDCEVPFRPSAGKPVYCNDCFGRADKTGGKKTDQLEQQFVRLNSKLDNILKVLTSGLPVVTPQPASVKKEKVSAKPKPVAKKSATKKKKK